MPRPRAHVLLLLLLLLPAARRADALVIARPPPGLTVEWRLAHADAVLRGVVTAHDRKAVAGDTFEYLTLRVAETLKGPVQPGDSIRVVVRNVNAFPWFDAGRQGKEYVFYLVDSESLAREFPAAALKADAWRSVPWAVPDRQSFNEPTPLFETPRDPLVAYTAGMKLLTTRDAILTALRREAARGQFARRDVDLQLSSAGVFLKCPPDAYLTDLLVPLDDRAFANARKWADSPDPLDRLNAAVVLAEFESPQSVAILRRLLDDPFVAPFAGWPHRGGFEIDDADTGKWTTGRCPVRQAAWGTLVTWHAQPSEALIAPPRLPHASIPHATWRAALIAAAFLPAAVLLRPSRRRRDRRPRLLAGPAGVSLLLLLAAATFWLRSAWRIDDLAFPAGPNHRVELASIAGHLRILTLAPSNSTAPALWITAPRTADNLTAWRDDTLLPNPDRKGVYGFEYETGHLTTGWRESTPLRLVRIPWWSLTALFSILPLRRAHQWRQFRRRQDQGHCLRCGYDLRATPGRCPECGFTGAAHARA